MNRKIYSLLSCAFLLFIGCNDYDSFEDELNLSFESPSIAFSDATLEAVHMREGEILEVDILMPTAIPGDFGVEVSYSFDGESVYGNENDFIVQVVESNDESGREIIKEATATGGSFIIKNKIRVDDRGNLVYTNVRNRATMKVITYPKMGIDKPEGRSLKIVLNEAQNLDDPNMTVNVGQGGVKTEYQIMVDDAHCPTALQGEYVAELVYEGQSSFVGDVTLTAVDDGESWGKYEVSNIAGDLFGGDIPFYVFDQCGDFISPKDDNISLEGAMEEGGKISLFVTYQSDLLIGNEEQQWILTLVKKNE
ncbi:hypothetical protein V6R21_26230 [Limibacter armeniacum]|uniref:hypothetical protein n=1 Tax=Limibacter armeniacum TaxID=466084 RepID=UPI002FE657AD